MFIRGRCYDALKSTRHFFNKPSKKELPSSGLFGNERLKTPQDFAQLNKDVRTNCSTIINQIVNGREDRTTVELFDDLSNEICKAADLVECTRQLHSDPAYNKAAEESARDFCELVESLNTYTPIYEKLKNSKELESQRLDHVDERTIDLFLDDFQQSGVHLPSDKRQKFVELSGEIFDVGARFQWACDKEVTVPISERRKFGSESAIYTPISHSSSRDKRRHVYTTYYKHNDQQELLLKEMVTKRNELAQLTGFESFAHRAQYNTLLGTYENAKQFLEGVINACRSSADKELAVLMDVQSQCEAGNTAVAEYDVNFLTNLYKERAFGREYQSEAAAYLTMGNVMNGFTNITEKLYGIRLEEQTPLDGELWPGNVLKFVAVNEQNAELGHVYLDIERRSTKSMGDCHYTVRCSKQLPTGVWQKPIVVLSLSIADVDSRAKNWKNVSLNIHSAENLFHELGHAMHSILGKTKYQHVAGTRCPQDFSEIPSNLMEYFFNNTTVLQTVLREPSGRGISFETAASIISSRFAFSALETVQQASYALFDLELHGPLCEQISSNRMTTTELLQRILTSSLPHLQRDPSSAFQHRFHHLVQYGAKYYSYLVARSAASLIWSSAFEHDPFNRVNGLKWAQVQSHGGGLHPSVLLKTILGSPPTPENLIRTLHNEVSPLSNLGTVNI